MSFMLRKSVIYKTNKGVEKTRYDFVPKVLPIKAFLAHFENRLAEIAPTTQTCLGNLRTGNMFKRNFLGVPGYACRTFQKISP